MRRSALAIAFVSCAAAAGAATFTVTNTADSGPGSLRQAILGANANPGNDDIAFAIPAPGVQTIVLASGLPPITQPVLIDGFTQPGATFNTNPTGQGLNASMLIQIDGTGAASEPCIQVFAGNDKLLVMAIQGLVINRCPVGAIHVGTGGDGALIVGNYIGTDPSGTSVPGPQGFGIRIVNALFVGIGGSLAFERNLISGHTDAGVVTDTAAFLGVRGNLIGTNAAGTAALAGGPLADGLVLDVAASVVVGGADPASRNVISGVANRAIRVSNADASGSILGNFIGTDVTGTQPIGGGVGIDVVDASPQIRGNVIAAQGGVGIELERSSSVIQGNFVGTDAGATLALGNTGGGIYALEENGDITIGGLGPGEGNVIAHNGRTFFSMIGGVHVRGPKVTIRGNRIFDNLYLGIDLLNGRAGGAVTPNDPGDLDTGPNLSQNFPIITNVGATTGATLIQGYLDSTPSTAFDVDLFFGPSCNVWPWGYAQGEQSVGSIVLTTDGGGKAAFSTSVPFQIQPGQQVTATATDPQGHTSEFSQRIILSIDPKSGPAEGGTPVTILGMDFGPSTAVAFSGLPLGNLAVVDYGTITGTAPALPPGVAYDVVASNLSGGYSLEKAWLSDFLDVPAGHPFHDYVVRLVTNGVSAGVGAGNFGVGVATTRQQMAVFLLKAKHGICYVPPACSGVFADVPCPSTFAPWIEALAAAGIAGGCGGGNFCPQNPVRRDQMAPLLIKARAGSDFVPDPCVGLFDDVPCPSTFADWIETLANGNITGGCGLNLYCPLNPVTRGQMAVFVTKTFFLF